MRVHHLNCGSCCPVGGALFDGASRRIFASLVTHCLLVESASGLILIDTGFGLQDVFKPHPRLPLLWRSVINVRLREDETAVRQIERLGYSARDVRHIILTHLDFDHAGGLDDFPNATVHLMAAEYEAAQHSRHSFVTHQRYRPRQWNRVRDWRMYGPCGEPWFGFEAVRELEGLPPEILLLPLRGHTLGHAGVALQTDNGWLLHAGDAYLHHGQMNPEIPQCPSGLAAYQYVMDMDRSARRRNQERLRHLKRDQADNVKVICSHDAREYRELV